MVLNPSEGRDEDEYGIFRCKSLKLKLKKTQKQIKNAIILKTQPKTE